MRKILQDELQDGKYLRSGNHRSHWCTPASTLILDGWEKSAHASVCVRERKCDAWVKRMCATETHSLSCDSSDGLPERERWPLLQISHVHTLTYTRRLMEPWVEELITGTSRHRKRERKSETCDLRQPQWQANDPLRGVNVDDKLTLCNRWTLSLSLSLSLPLTLSSSSPILCVSIYFAFLFSLSLLFLFLSLSSSSSSLASASSPARFSLSSSLTATRVCVSECTLITREVKYQLYSQCTTSSSSLDLFNPTQEPSEIERISHSQTEWDAKEWEKEHFSKSLYLLYMQILYTMDSYV